VLVRSCSTTSRPALQAAASGGRPRPAATRASPASWPHQRPNLRGGSWGSSQLPRSSCACSGLTKGYGSSWIFGPCLTCTNALRRVQYPDFSLVTAEHMEALAELFAEDVVWHIQAATRSRATLRDALPPSHHCQRVRAFDGTMLWNSTMSWLMTTTRLRCFAAPPSATARSWT
jgi:hypothetical protein